MPRKLPRGTSLPCDRRQRNPRECRGFSHTGKYHSGDPTAWLSKQDSNQSMHFICIAFSRRKRERNCVALEAVSSRRRLADFTDISADLLPPIVGLRLYGAFP